MTTDWTLEVHDRLDRIPAEEWNSLFASPHPFVQHGFLRALEASGAVSARTGWQPAHLALRYRGRRVAVAPAYLKSHSYGEYVFDWAWADAYQRLGQAYYPKLLTAIPFSPVQGPRIGLSSDFPPELLWQQLSAHVTAWCQEHGVSSWHVLFSDPLQSALIQAEGSLLPREGTQFHWFDHGYGDFQGFLGQLNARKRKNIRKERERVAADGITFRWILARDWDSALVSQFQSLYADTYHRHGQAPYLNADTWTQWGQAFPEQLLLLLAEQQGTTVAAALFLRDPDTLYGRYWGSRAACRFLHFETCYYQGIDYCLRHGLRRFDAGAQGEHKLLRGFEPQRTSSWHWIADTRFRTAIGHFLERERTAVGHYREEAADYLPFRRELQ